MRSLLFGRNHLRSRLWAAAVMAMLAATASCSPAGRAAEGGSGPFRMAIAFYRGPLDHLNSVRTGSCPMHPGCSSYSLQAIDKHGPLIGWMMACDRLMRCGRDELQRSPAVFIDGSRRCPDPVAANDWWWHTRGSASGREGDKAVPPGGTRSWRIRIDPQQEN